MTENLLETTSNGPEILSRILHHLTTGHCWTQGVDRDEATSTVFRLWASFRAVSGPTH